MALDDATKARVCDLFERRLHPEVWNLGIPRPNLILGVEATETWIEANKASYNAALPQVVRDALSAKQKTLLFCYVAAAMAGIVEG